MAKKVLVALLVLLVVTSEISPDIDQSIIDDSVGAQQFEFQAEVASLMDIIVNSLYVNKEVFIRELISNASDAMDKVRFLALVNPDYVTGDLGINIQFDLDKKTLTITDRGVGMTRSDLVEKLGTVAKSGTTQFLDIIASGGSLNLIGQFGVGFYSVFLVADKVVVRSKHDDDDQHVWISSAGPHFVVKQDTEGNTLGRGTEITLHLKQDAEEFIDQKTLEETIQEYSEFVDYPIFLHKQVDEWYDRPMTEDEILEEEDTEKLRRNNDIARKRKEHEEKIASGELAEDTPFDEDEAVPLTEPPERVKRDSRKVWAWEQINASKAIWMNKPEDNKIKDYVKLYQTLKKDASEPLYFAHFHAEGEVEFKSIIFIPDSPPTDMFQNYHTSTSGLRLYVRRVLIADGPKDVMPKYLNFLKGVIHSDDVPLNVSRETLQQQRIIKIISNKIVKKVLDALLDLADDKDDWAVDKPNKEDYDYESIEDETLKKEVEREYQVLLRWSATKGKSRYLKFWEHFSKNVKLGVIEDSVNRKKLVKLLRFHTTLHMNELTSLEEYVERMPSSQDYIYFLAGDDKKVLNESPLIQSLKQTGFEVILLEDSLDEYTFGYITEFSDKKVKNVAKGELELQVQSDHEVAKEQKLKEMFKPLTDWWKALLGSEVDKVTLSRRLVNDPVVVRTADSGYTANMYRIAKAQAYANQQKIPAHWLPVKVLEINAGHPAIKQMLEMLQENAASDELVDYAWLYYQTALISSGFSLNEDIDFSTRLSRLLRKKMGVSISETLQLPDVDIEEDFDPELIDDELDFEVIDEDFEVVDDDSDLLDDDTQAEHHPPPTPSSQGTQDAPRVDL